MTSEEDENTRTLRVLQQRQERLRSRRLAVALQESTMAQKIKALDAELRRLDEELRELSL